MARPLHHPVWRVSLSRRDEMPGRWFVVYGPALNNDLGEAVMATVTAEDVKIEAKAKVMEAVEDAKRAIVKGKVQFEDLKDTATYRIKKAPLASVGIGFGAGILLGAIVGMIAGRVVKNKASSCC
jgi:ElaB/YqjD/DUF883 family membrane-anchored ribosome-binding protein